MGEVMGRGKSVEKRERKRSKPSAIVGKMQQLGG